MNSIELIQAHISFLEQNMKHDSILKSSLINDDMVEIEAYKKVLKDLEVLEIIKKVGILDLVFSDDPYCNLVITNRDVINVDYDGHAPDIEMIFEDCEKIMRCLNNGKEI